MQMLGFKFEARQKCYYVDNHKSPENIIYRHQFIDCYFQYELRCYRWYSIPLEEQQQMIEEGKLNPDLGYQYEKNGKQYVEHHVDDHIDFQSKCANLPFGGNLSVRKKPFDKPIMIIGQDKAIFKQYLFTKGSWLTPGGKKQLVPKDEGQGIILSSFVSREIGFGYTPSTEIMNQVNEN